VSCRSCLLAALALLAPTSAGAGEVALPDGTVLGEVSFGRHVASLLGKMGCNAGACHGSFQGKGGLRLSLFGHSPAEDHLALTRGGMGRRVDRAAPERSLLLLKVTAAVPHGGGKRFDRRSWQYEVFRAWIAQGLNDDLGGEVRRLRVVPAEHLFAGPGQSLALRVVAEFADGTRADLTPFCTFRVKDEAIADVSPLGVVRALRPGVTPVIVAYRGSLTTSEMLVPAPAGKDFVYPQLPQANYIDREVLARLRKLRIVPSEPAGDAEFLRRVTIDTIGCLPAPAEVRAFLADRRPDKRARKIDALLAHPLHAALWATRLCDVTANNVDVMDGPPEERGRRARMWHDWFRRRLADNVPYDQIVHGVLCATSRDGQPVQRWIDQEVARAAGKGADYARKPSLDLFWRRLGGDDFFPLEQMAELTAAAFLGVRLECAQCHKHPFDRWTQTDYRAYANVFAQVKLDASPEVAGFTLDLLAARRKLPPGKAGPPIPRLREVYADNHSLRRLSHPRSGAVLPARALGGPVIPLEGDAREALFRWLARPDHPFFARSFVNRVWAHYFGTGLVEPVDGFSAANPPANAALLDALARDFTAHGHDIRRLERTILTSRTYQLSSRPNAGNARDRGNYARAPVRRMLAEVVVDVLNSALGVEEDFGPDAPPGAHAIEVATNRVRSPGLARVFRVFGRPPRTATCDCERPAEPALPQTLFLMTDPGLLRKFRTGRLGKLLAEKRSDDAVIEELFLATLSRFPDEREWRAAREHVRGAPDRRAAFVDMLWALCNTREFILNH
jgi:hypothetical protein